MRRLALALLFLAALAVCPGASAWTGSPTLDKIATRIAGQPVEVRCYAAGEEGDPLLDGAWGYVWLFEPTVYLAGEVCDGALSIADQREPPYEQALGALVLTHESYHLALRYPGRGDEARTECRAVRHFQYVARFLGASDGQAKALLPYALAIHYRLAAVYQEYFDRSCEVPWWWR